MFLATIKSTLQENYFVSYIYLYIFLMPWNFANGQMGLLSLILFIWWLIIAKDNAYFNKLKYILKFKPLVLIIIFFLYSYLSLLWTNNFVDALIALKYYKYYWIMIPILFTSLSVQQATNGLFILIVSLGTYALFSYLIYLNIIYIEGIDTSNPRGILAYAIVTPYMAIAFLSSIIIVLNQKNNYVKILFFTIALLSLLGIFINNGRAGQLSFIITALILLLFNIKSMLNPKAFFILILTIILSIFVFNSSGKLTRFKSSFSELQNLEEKQFAGNWGERAYMWYAAGSILKENYIVGVGAGDNIDEFIEYTKTHPSKATWLRSFHNQHLDTLTKYGIIGFVLLWSSVILLLVKLSFSSLYFHLGIIFFSVSFFDGVGDIILLMKPYNTIFMLVFLLFSVIVYKNKKEFQEYESKYNSNLI